MAEFGAVSPAEPARGYAKLYHARVLQADEGADFDFLQHEELDRK
jgi:dihydroxy-acid dehydratase